MCSYGQRCDPANNCTTASEVLGCAKYAGACETCAIGFLVSQPPPQTEGKATLHKSRYATLGKLRANKGWEITRPGTGVDLAVGDFVTELNGLRLDVDVESAAKAMVAFYAYKGASVTVGLLSAGGRVIQRPFERK